MCDDTVYHAMFVVTNHLPVADGREDDFEELFEERAGSVARRPGVRRLELLRPAEAGSYAVRAYWSSREAFGRWRASDEFRAVHADLPDGLLDGSNRIESHELAVERDASEE